MFHEYVSGETCFCDTNAKAEVAFYLCKLTTQARNLSSGIPCTMVILFPVPCTLVVILQACILAAPPFTGTSRCMKPKIGVELSFAWVEFACAWQLAGYEVDTLSSVPVLGQVYNTGNTCLHLAAQNGHLDMVECLLDRGANPRLIDFRWVLLAT